MSLIKSISGIRGTIGGAANENLTPIDIVKFATAYAKWLKDKYTQPVKVVVGRDGRISGAIVKNIVINTLLSMGVNVIDAGLSTTPTIEMAVLFEKADGGIIITASHNPKEWNALKLLNSLGEFISKEDGDIILKLSEEKIAYAAVEKLGKLHENKNYIKQHINEILKYKWVDTTAIKKRKLKIVADVINSTGALALPYLLQELEVEFILLNDTINGHFAHNPEPLPEHLTALSNAVKEHNADMGIAVDPDVDRLCFVCENGQMFGEEYTLVAIADYILKNQKGNTVSNLSSSRALKDITTQQHCNYFASAVGEVNVVAKMKEVKAIIGGEGNGGIIVPDFHYGRDALIGIALFLTAYTDSGKNMSQFKEEFPQYIISKEKLPVDENIDFADLVNTLIQHFEENQINIKDGLKIDFEKGWVHLRKSNTEPIIRMYIEAGSVAEINSIATIVKSIISKIQTGNHA